MKSIILKKGRESSLLRKHPWVFSGAIDRVTGDPGFGETICILDNKQNFLAQGAWSPESQISARVWSFDEHATINTDFFRELIHCAITRRSHLEANAKRSAYRLIYGESDNLPGLVVDRYNDFLVCQFLTAGVESWRNSIIELLSELISCTGIYERSDVASRRKEGLDDSTGVLWGEAPPTNFVIREYDYQLGVNIATGHKTGYYLDQADNRHFLSTISTGKTVLNCFSYTGGFSVSALKGGATDVINVDSSAAALAMAEENLHNNGFSPGQYSTINANVFELLREFRQDQRQFDIVILDPPKFGRGPDGEVWRLEEGLPALVSDCRQLLDADSRFLFLTVYAVRMSSLALGGLLDEVFAGLPGKIEHGDLAVQEDGSGRLLPTAIFARWSNPR